MPLRVVKDSGSSLIIVQFNLDSKPQQLINTVEIRFFSFSVLYVLWIMFSQEVPTYKWQEPLLFHERTFHGYIIPVSDAVFYSG